MAEERQDADILNPFAKNKKQPKQEKEAPEMRSTQVSTMPPAQALFGRLIQTMNAANTQNVKSNNPGWDVYASDFRKRGSLQSYFGPVLGGRPDPLREIFDGGGLEGLFKRLGLKFPTPQTTVKTPEEMHPLLMKMSKDKVEKVMGEFKDRKLHSGSKTGPVVKNRKQAIAIALSEARDAGQDVPEKKSEVRAEYVQGFIQKCAEAGVDPEELAKSAQFFQGLGEGFMNPISTAQDMNPLLSFFLGKRKKPLSQRIGRAVGSLPGLAALPVTAPLNFLLGR